MAKDNPIKLMKDATGYAAKGKFDKALECYQKLIQLNPKDTKLWVKTGDTLRKLGHNQQAIDFYTKAAAQYALHGFLMQAISVNKLILEIDPAHNVTQEALAELYAKKEGNMKPPVSVQRPATAPAPKPVTATTPPPPAPDAEISTPGQAIGAIKLQKLHKPKVDIVEKVRTKAAEAPETPDLMAEVQNLIDSFMEEDFAEIASGKQNVADFAAMLPEYPLFSAIDPEVFADVIWQMTLHRFEQGNTIVEEGDIGTAFYVIAEGQASLWKRDAGGAAMQVGVLSSGDFFGEFGSLTGTPRAVSVIADEDMLVLEIAQGALNELMAKHAELSAALDGFYRDRLVGTILQTSPIFKPLSQAEREQILKFFEYVIFEPQQELIAQGTEGKELVVIVSGQVAVTVKDRDGNENMVAILREGDFMGEISLLTGKPTTATCTAINRTHVYRLKGEVFKELIAQYPAIRDTVKHVAKHRVEGLRSGYMGQDEFYKAGLV